MPTADQMLGSGTVQNLVRIISAVCVSQDYPALADSVQGVQGLSMRQRVDRVADALVRDVGPAYADIAAVFRGVAAEYPQDFQGWMMWPVTEAAARSALEAGTDAAFYDALALMAELTHRFTAEFAIRSLLRHDCDAALAVIGGWVYSDDEHVRRLASEGTRLFLPWGAHVPQLAANPYATLPILDALHEDPSEYVRRSVANHLNDLSRDHADVVLKTARRWLVSGGRNAHATVKHALRTLIKQGDRGALELMGFGPVEVEVSGPIVGCPVVPWGTSLDLSVKLHNYGEETARVAVDYVVDHLRANGTYSSKVFKWTTLDIAAGHTVELVRKHSMKEITTRRYYPGIQGVCVQVNGVRHERMEFELLPKT